jgi:hypothetical protein
VSAAASTEASLAMRLLDTVPAASHEMTALLGLFRIEVTREVPTAAVSCEQRPVLKVNPDFVEAHCKTDEHLFLLVMHELHHVLLGHTRLFPRATPLHNIAFDAVINALLCARFPGKEHTSFFLEYYGREDGPRRLLAPPSGKPISDPELRAVHRLLYPAKGSPCDATFKEVFDRLVAVLGKSCNLKGGRLLLGDHSPDEDGAEEGDFPDREVVGAIRAIVEKWPKSEKAAPGRSLSSIVENRRVMYATPGERVLEVLRKALKSASSDTSSNPSSKRRPAPLPALVPFPVSRDRRATVARLSGVEPLLFSGELVAMRVRASGRALAYLDVSGSMNPYLSYLYASLVRLQDFVEPRIHLFSTKVATVPLSAIAQGRVQTTGGTEGGCALEHALQVGARRVLFLTDGIVGMVGPTLAQKVRATRMDVRVVLTPGGRREDLAPVASRFDELPEFQGERSPT